MKEEGTNSKGRRRKNEGKRNNKKPSFNFIFHPSSFILHP
jgi:hypothetical protein